MLRCSRKIRAVDSYLVRAESLDRDCVNLGLEQISQGIEYQSVTRNPGQAGKSRRHHHDTEMPAPVAGAGMPRVEMAFVLDLQQLRV
jgi:hypothetical protein